MAPITKHYGKKERECDDCVYTGIRFLVLGNPVIAESEYYSPNLLKDQVVFV